ncbi:MAG: cytochrome C oxidase subunit IV family protein [Saprospirales bacterium]|jgi:cytochrome c oxidase subunit 4|nr:cytochrome C oxidase subunit IV family protein [Saprospirales bacterium]MBK8921340.1 cytochrome C oxidase subunit IV family protein [Saprospirales bacterium]
MAGHQTYEEQKALVFRGLLLLGAITMIEVVIALLAKGHLVHGIKFSEGFGHYLYMLLMIGFSLYKAYFIIFFFMHMAYEVRGLAISVLLPTALLIWAIIAFFQEGSSWGARRKQIKEKNEELVKPAPAGAPQGYLLPGAAPEFVI